ncbi:MAG: efflux RND transporter permease subunit [Phycisphaerales bacterium]|nr:MAG: efflux RND transporter permease subunit [Phycisphaerales bacterium]
MKAIEVTLRNPYLVVVLVLATLVVGVRAMMDIPADLLPQFNTPAVQIVCFYPGMPPEVMERDIMSRLERWTGQSVGIEHQEAKAMLGVCVVKDFFREDISFDTAMSQVTSYAMSDMFYLPPGTIPPMVMPFDPTASVPLCLVSVSSPTMTEKELYDVAYYELRNRLQAIQGVIAPAVYGGVLRRILAYVDPMELAARGLSPMDVVKTLQDQSVFIPTGNAKFGDIDYQIISNAMTDTVQEMNELPVKSGSDAVVFLRDIGEIKDSHQIQSNKVRINGRAMAYIPIYRQPGANTLEIVDAIRSKLERINVRLRQMDPKAKDLVLGVVMDQSTTVRASVRWLQVSAVLGAILAGIVVLVFLRSVRLTFIVFLAIPLSILAALIGLFYTGDTINSMTLGGLALAIGILVDQSIVVLDNIVRHVRMGKPTMQAALDGTREVSLPVLVSTVTFVIVFFPVVFLSGIPRFLFQPLAVTVTLAVVASYLIAMLVIPSLSARLLRSVPAAVAANPGQGPTNESPPWFNRLFSRVMKLRYVVILAAFVLLAVTGLTATKMGTELFPKVDSNQFAIYVRLPSGTRIENTERVIAQVEQSIMEHLGEPDPDPKDEKYPDSNLRIVISNIGVLMDWPAAYTPNNGPMDAFVLVQTKGKSDRPNTFETVDALRQRLGREFPTVEFAFDTDGMMTAALNFGLPSPIQVQVSGSNLKMGQRIAQEIKRLIDGVPGTTDVRIAQRLDYPQIGVDVDRVKAAQLGIVQKDVIKNVVTALNSSIGFNPAFWIAPNFNHYFIGAQYAEHNIDSMETLRDIPITGTRSRLPIPLRNVARFYRTTGPAVVNHHNITRVTDVFANVASGHDAGSVADAIEESLKTSSFLNPVQKKDERGTFYDLTGAFKGYSFKIKGETETMRNAFGQFAAGLAIAAILVYLAMVAQLRSFAVPLIIIVSVPLGFIGVIAALKITGTHMSIPAFMGIIMMTGIVVEYSIILLEFANRRVRDGLPVRRAIQEATWIRLRPILMTSLTTWLALMPMAIGAAGGEANAPLARTIIGGVLAATVLSIIVVPCLYSIVRREEDAKLSAVAESA